MQGSPSVFLLLALLSDGAAVASLELSRGLSKRLPALALVVFYSLSLICLTFALNVKGFELGMIYAAWSGVGIAAAAVIELFWKQNELAAPNWLLHRRDQIACAVFTPIDSLEWRSRRSWARSPRLG